MTIDLRSKFETNAVNGAKIAAERDFFLIGVDNTIYPESCGFLKKTNMGICALVAADASIVTQTDRMGSWLGKDQEIELQHWLHQNRKTQLRELPGVYPMIVEKYFRQGLEKFQSFLDKVYPDDNYRLIPPDPRLVEAVLRLKDAGKEIVFYSNSPSSRDPAKDWHIQKVLKRLGFERDFIDEMREKTYDVTRSIWNGYAKPSEKGLDDCLESMKVDPLKAVYIDGNIKNLQARINQSCINIYNNRILCILTRTGPAFPDDRVLVLARAFDFITVSSASHALANIAKHVQPIGQEAKSVSVKNKAMVLAA